LVYVIEKDIICKVFAKNILKLLEYAKQQHMYFRSDYLNPDIYINCNKM